MLRFLLSIGEEELGDNVADMIAYSTDDNLLLTPSIPHVYGSLWR